MIIEYIAMVLASTIGFRKTFEEYKYQLTSFYSYHLPENSEPMFWQVLLNIILFVPIGLLFRGILKNLWTVVICSCIFSICIETLQLVFRKGLCETDDVIHNTLGAAIGCMIYIALSRGVKQLRS